MINNYKIICSRFNEDIRWILPFIQNTIIVNKGNDDLHYIPQEHIIKYLNEGREGGTYLKYIIDNYENLPDYILFIQGNPFDHIYGNDNKKRGIDEIHNIINNRNVQFKYLSKHNIYLKKEELTDYCSGIPRLCNEQFKIKMDITELIHLIQSLNIIQKDIINALHDKLTSLSSSQTFIYIHEFMEFIKNDGYFFNNKSGQDHREVILTRFKDRVLETIVEHEYYFGHGALFWVNKTKILKHSKSFWIRLDTGFNELMPSAGWGLEKTWPFILNDYYDRVEWIFNYPTLSSAPFFELLQKGYIDNQSNKTILFISNEVNHKYYCFKRNNNDVNVCVGCDKLSSLNNYFNNNNNNNISFIYLNTSPYIEFKNSFECIIKNIHTSCYFIVDNCINVKGFYLDNEVLSYLYSYHKENNNLQILGTYEKSILCKFSK